MDEKEKFTVEAERENTEVYPISFEEITKELMGAESFEKSETAKKLLDKKFRSGKPYSAGIIKIFLTEYVAIWITNVFYEGDEEDGSCRKTGALVFDRLNHRLITYKFFDIQRTYDNVLNFMIRYYPIFLGDETLEIEDECDKTYTGNVFELRNNMICLRGTEEVLINLLIEKERKKLENIIKEIEDIPVVSTKELNEVGGGYVFRNKADVDKVVRESGWNPTTLYKKLYDMKLIYKERDRYSRRSRSKDVENSTGSEQFFGIKSNALEILKGCA